ncbi:MAG: RNA polymerase sigma factor [Nitrospirota bacterium]|nr:RNA polymerase sigma factor [Nitrospirota bacterium]MDE3241695.1 RNA polymerase sigma factor [Nitrospirota bacterium]
MLGRGKRAVLPQATPRSSGTTRDEQGLLVALRGGEEAAFASLVERYHGSLIRVALAYVSDRSVAEEVVQETWIGVLEGLDRFEGRSSLKTWIFSILTNKAKSRGVRESRHVSFSAIGDPGDDSNEPAVDPSRFVASGFWVDHWASPPHPWDEETPEKRFLTKEGGIYLEKAIQALPPHLRQVLVMRDVEGLGSKEVCGFLEISEANQRVLLHRARAKVRQALERYVNGEIPQP